MRKNIFLKKIYSILLSSALMAGLIVSPVMPGIETLAADNYEWVLTSSKCDLNETKVEQYHKNYYSQYNPTTAGMIGMKHSGGYYDTSKWSHCDRYYECQVPASTLATGANVSLRMTLTTANVDCKTSGDTLYGVSCAGCSVYLGDYSRNPFKDQNGEKELYIGTAAGRPYTDKNVTVTKTVSNKMPDSTNEGATTNIHFDNGAGSYIWTYTLKKAGSSGATTSDKKEEIKKKAIAGANTAAEVAKKNPTADKIKAAKDAITAAEKAGASANELSTSKTALKAAEDAAKKAEEEKKAAEAAKKAEEERKAAEEAAKSDGSKPGVLAPEGNELKDAAGNTTGFVVTNATTGEVEYKGTDADRAATGAVTIPAEVKDRSGNTYKVTGIAPEALKGAAGKTLNIGVNIKKIGKNAFKDAAFSKINLQTEKKGKVSIGKGAFKTKKKATIKVKGAKGTYKTKLIKKIKKQAHKKSKVK